MLNELLSVVGFPTYIVSKYGIKTYTSLKIDNKTGGEPKLYWRVNPRLGCEFSYIQSLSEPTKVSEKCSQITLTFQNDSLTIEMNDDEEMSVSTQVYSHIKKLLDKARIMYKSERDHNTPKGATQPTQGYKHMMEMRTALIESALKEEQLIQLCFYLRYKEAYLLVERAFSSFRGKVLDSAFRHWINVTKDTNEEKMVEDRARWRLHATANQEIDLQAWYHGLFYQEVYRLRGHFWYKDAVLPVYKKSYDLVDNALTPLEEAALAHVLCSPDTSYGDVAGQMFIVQALISQEQFVLFQQLAAQGSQVIKYPRSGRPAKKLFRFSFVEGNIYLTWKGKFGNQGVGMGEVTSVSDGIQSDVLKWTAASSKEKQYLSVNCADRSIDLLFDSQRERDDWRGLLQALVTKEKGILENVEPIDYKTFLSDDTDYEKLFLFASIGKVC